MICNYGRSCGVLRVRGKDVAQIMIGEGAGPPTGVWGDAVPETNGMVRMSNGDAPKPMGSWRPRSCQNRKIVLCARSHDASEERTRVRARAQGGRPAISGDPEGAKEGRCRHPQDSDHARSRHRHGAAE
jgi:hypothetical protein